VGSQSRSGNFEEEINMLFLPGIERRSPGQYSVVGHFKRGVLTDGSHILRGILGSGHA
jgi:hypothetical protein